MTKESITALLASIAGASALFANYQGAGVILFSVATLIILYASFKQPAKQPCDMKQHPLFQRMKYFREIKINSLNFSTPKKQDLFRKALLIKFDISEKIIREQLFNNKVSRNLFLDIINGYENAWNTERFPKIFIDKFRKWHNPRLIEGNEQLNFILDSTFHQGDEKIVAILDLCLHLYNWTIIDAEQSLSQLNGELEKAL